MSNFQPGGAEPPPQPRVDPQWASGASPLPPPSDSPYEFTPYDPRNARRPAATPSRMGLAILATFLFLPLGVYAIYLANQVGSKGAVGDTAGAMEASHKVKTISTIAIVIGGLFWLFVLMSACAAMMTAASYSTY